MTRYPVIGNQSAYPVYLTGIGMCEPETDCVRENGLTSHQFLVTLDGSGILEVDAHKYTQKNGDFFILRRTSRTDTIPKTVNGKQRG